MPTSISITARIKRYIDIHSLMVHLPPDKLRRQKSDNFIVKLRQILDGSLNYVQTESREFLGPGEYHEGQNRANPVRGTSSPALNCTQKALADTYQQAALAGEGWDWALKRHSFSRALQKGAPLG